MTTWRTVLATAAGVVAALALLATVLVVYLLSPVLIGTPHSKAVRMQDQNSLRQIVTLVAESGKLPMKDGAFDPYSFVRKRTIQGSNYRLLRSDRSGTGPTDEEIERGDYSNFPWERYRGDGKLEGPPFPLLWERKPDEEGRLLVALSDGSVRYGDHAEVERLLATR